LASTRLQGLRRWSARRQRSTNVYSLSVGTVPGTRLASSDVTDLLQEQNLQVTLSCFTGPPGYSYTSERSKYPTFPRDGRRVPILRAAIRYSLSLRLDYGQCQSIYQASKSVVVISAALMPPAVNYFTYLVPILCCKYDSNYYVPYMSFKLFCPVPVHIIQIIPRHSFIIAAAHTLIPILPALHSGTVSYPCFFGLLPSSDGMVCRIPHRHTLSPRTGARSHLPRGCTLSSPPVVRSGTVLVLSWFAARRQRHGLVWWRLAPHTATPVSIRQFNVM
jgi:hypothetical protein